MEDETAATVAGRKPFGVEVLGLGNQFVAIGWHPDGAFLEWTDGRHLLETPQSDLPAVIEARVAEFLSLVGELLGSRASRQNRQKSVSGNGGSTIGSFSGSDTDMSERDAPAHITDSAVMVRPQGSDVVLLAAPVASAVATSASEPHQLEPSGGKPLTLLDKLIAKRKLVEGRKQR